MTMDQPRFAIRLLAYGRALGIREEVVGDIVEEINSGRSRSWVCTQLIGLLGVALLTRVRTRARVTPQIVALALCGAMFAGASVGSVSRMLQVWLGVYYVTGTLSLFAHMASHTFGARANVISDAADGSPPG
jgi:uncharacterized membrane protein YoaK (UPF0700 family)